MATNGRPHSSSSSLRQSLGLPRRVEGEGEKGGGAMKKKPRVTSVMPPRHSLAKRPPTAPQRRMTADRHSR